MNVGFSFGYDKIWKGIKIDKGNSYCFMDLGFISIDRFYGRILAIYLPFMSIIFYSNHNSPGYN